MVKVSGIETYDGLPQRCGEGFDFLNQFNGAKTDGAGGQEIEIV
jgi:hypothetical protein